MKPLRTTGSALFFAAILISIAMAPASPAAEAADETGAAIVDIAESQIGLHDRDGGLVGLYHGHLQAWCSEFVCWCYMQAGIPMSGGRHDLGLCWKDWNLENAARVIRYFKKNHLYYEIDELPTDLVPRPGDYAFITDTEGKRSHSAIVKQVRLEADGTETLITVEGNNKGREVDIYSYPDWRNNTEGEGVVGGIGLRR